MQHFISGTLRVTNQSKITEFKYIKYLSILKKIINATCNNLIFFTELEEIY